MTVNFFHETQNCSSTNGGVHPPFGVRLLGLRMAPNPESGSARSTEIPLYLWQPVTVCYASDVGP